MPVYTCHTVERLGMQDLIPSPSFRSLNFAQSRCLHHIGFIRYACFLKWIFFGNQELEFNVVE